CWHDRLGSGYRCGLLRWRTLNDGLARWISSHRGSSDVARLSSRPVHQPTQRPSMLRGPIGGHVLGDLTCACLEVSATNKPAYAHGAAHVPSSYAGGHRRACTRSWLGSHLLHDVELDIHYAPFGHLQCFGRGSGNVDGTSANERTAIVDPDRNGASIGQVGD